MASTRLRPVIPAGLVLALLVGCASQPRPERTVMMGSENRVFLILPFNVAVAMPSELESLSPIVWKELEIYLREQGKELKTVSRQAARNLWIRSIRKVRAGEKGARAGYEDAARALVLELRKYADFDAMIVPSLFIREARISNLFASWDGVERRVEFERLDFGDRSLATTPLEGVAPAASLHVAAFDAQGEKLFEAQGGLELLVRVRVARESPSEEPKFEFATRTDLFANREHVREGINEAFASFLPPLPR